MAESLSLQEQLLKASLLCGLRPNEGVAHRLQLFFTANAILHSASKQSDFQRCLETGVDDFGYWENYGKGSGNYVITESGYSAAVKRFGKVESVFPPTDGASIHFQIEGSIDDLSFRMETIGKSSKVYLNGEPIRNAKLACAQLQQKKGISLPTSGESAPRILYNLAVERGFSLIWKGKSVSRLTHVVDPHDRSGEPIDDTAGAIEPPRQSVTIDRIIRDTEISRKIKELHNSKCQICGKSLGLGGNRFYAEAHHIKPLGSPHNGPDTPENIICVCPEHHVLLDYGAIKLTRGNITIEEGHQVSDEYISYHNSVIWPKAQS